MSEQDNQGQELSQGEELLLGIGSITPHDTEAGGNLLSVVNGRIQDIMYGSSSAEGRGSDLNDRERLTILTLLQGEVSDQVTEEMRTSGGEPPSMTTFRRLGDTRQVLEVRMQLSRQGGEINQAIADAAKLNGVRKQRRTQQPPTPPTPAS